jgi:hypothetical protein
VPEKNFWMAAIVVDAGARVIGGEIILVVMYLQRQKIPCKDAVYTANSFLLLQPGISH